NGLDYDLFSVATHEIGHALGLDHSSFTSAVEYATYNGVASALTADDIAGIRSIYSGGNPRSPDRYDAVAGNGSFLTATDITATVTINVSAGQQYYIVVAGANATAFGTGAYALTLNFGSGAAPTVAPPNTQTPNGNPLNGGGGLADRVAKNGDTVSLTDNCGG